MQRLVLFGALKKAQFQTIQLIGLSIVKDAETMVNTCRKLIYQSVTDKRK